MKMDTIEDIVYELKFRESSEFEGDGIWHQIDKVDKRYEIKDVSGIVRTGTMLEVRKYLKTFSEVIQL